MALECADILKLVCGGDISQIELLRREKEFHWTSLLVPKTKDTCLHLAAKFGYPDIITYLLNKFHPRVVDVRNVDNKTPLHEAAQHGQYECVLILVSYGADINAIKRSDWTPLMLSCSKSGYNYTNIVKYLLLRGALLNFKNKDGWNCLHIAARNEDPTILKLLINSTKIDINSRTKNGRTVLHISSLHGRLESVRFLIPKLSIDSVDLCGHTVFHEAIFSGNIELVDYLADCGIDVGMSNKMGANALHLAAGRGLHYVVSHLVGRYGIDINSTDLNGYTPLHYAAKNGEKRTVTILLKLKAKCDISDKCGRLALDYLS